MYVTIQKGYTSAVELTIKVFEALCLKALRFDNTNGSVKWTTLMLTVHIWSIKAIYVPNSVHSWVTLQKQIINNCIIHCYVQRIQGNPIYRISFVTFALL